MMQKLSCLSPGSATPPRKWHEPQYLKKDPQSDPNGVLEEVYGHQIGLEEELS